MASCCGQRSSQTCLWCGERLIASCPSACEQPVLPVSLVQCWPELFFSCLCRSGVGKLSWCLQRLLWLWQWAEGNWGCTALPPASLGAPGVQQKSSRVCQASQQHASASAPACSWELLAELAALPRGQGHPACSLLQNSLRRHPDPFAMCSSCLAVVQWPEFTFRMGSQAAASPAFAR